MLQMVGSGPPQLRMEKNQFPHEKTQQRNPKSSGHWCVFLWGVVFVCPAVAYGICLIIGSCKNKKQKQMKDKKNLKYIKVKKTLRSGV